MNTCEWYLICDNPATKTRPHPVLGDVPICDRCDEKADQLATSTSRVRDWHDRADAWSRD